MADPMNKPSDMKDNPNQPMQHEQAKASISGADGSSQSGMRPDQQREKSAIGGGDTRGQGSDSERSETGEPGRARNELDESRTETSNQR